MESVASAFGRAVTAHREAVSHVEAARARLRDLLTGQQISDPSAADIRQWAARMRQYAARLTPGWLGPRATGTPLTSTWGVAGRSHRQGWWGRANSHTLNHGCWS